MNPTLTLLAALLLAPLACAVAMIGRTRMAFSMCASRAAIRINTSSCEKGFHSRETLVIQVSRPGELAAGKTWRVQVRTAPNFPTAFHYPCAIEHEGRLFAIYTVGGRRLVSVNSRSFRSPRCNSRTAEAIGNPKP